MIGVFIDGPLIGEVKEFPPGHSVWRVPLPATEVICDCDPGESQVFETAPREVVYHRIAAGPKVAIYSLEDDDEKVLVRNLESWVHTDLSSPLLRYHCRHRRAWV